MLWKFVTKHKSVSSFLPQKLEPIFEEQTDTDINDFLDMPQGASNLVYKLNLLEMVLCLHLFEWNLKLIYVNETSSLWEVKEVIDKEFESITLLFRGKKISLLLDTSVKI